ncbi:MAG: beta-galactosidase [Ornithinimicrobium sp.]|uniref:glycoside hydrolase family 35 protein n=1 Tax=Ornithinimicrobium sp. TaxID=1977084 RepID=UPI0026E08106|nr:beta-galactosidase family protein [Ornithinimicrobium sp.]MDO5739271.1 beta-galactosidase [Ornithinimicrobium sp.]
MSGSASAHRRKNMHADHESTTGTPTLTVADGTFRKGGEPHQILSGALHYFRVHPELWHDRLQRLRALGLNTVETYVAWNFHERRRGEIDFTGWRDLTRFVREAQSLGLDVILRPGPYIYAEWDFGGLPAWLMAEPDLALRTMDPRFITAVDAWFDAICDVMRPLLATHGGPVVAVQVENEYGSYGDDAPYLEHCRAALVDRGIDVLLLTSDGPGPDLLASGSVPGVHATVNFGSRVDAAFAELRRVQPSGPDMCMEFWNGWFDHWGERHHTREPAEAAAVLEEILARGASVNFYMAHGGTNFGLWNGCNVEDGQLQPTVTSYDYDGPVGEAGELGAKFYAYREVLTRYATGPVPEPLALLPRLAPGQGEVTEWMSLLDSLDAFDPPESAPMPRSMEQLGQDHGLVLYRGHVLLPPQPPALVLDGLADRATVMLDGAVIGIVDRNHALQEVALGSVPAHGPHPCDLVVIVENQGRINFAHAIGEHKGVAAIRLGRRLIHNWQSSALRLDDPTLTARLAFGPEPGSAGPVFARTVLSVDQPADGFIALPGWGKGFVWLNGFLLGRYWEVGPQVTLYAPAPLWRAGLNEVVVLEMEHAGSIVELRSEPDLGAGRGVEIGVPAVAAAVV